MLDQPRQGDLDAAARLAAYVCGTPTAVVNLIDADRQWQAAAHGTEPVEVPRGDAMCQHTVLGTEVVYTPDASAEALFVDNPFVTGRTASVRLYASAPLLTRDGHAVGTVCAFDERPGALDSVQLGLLRDVAAQVMALFEMRRMAAVLTRAATRDPLTGLGNRRAVEAAIHAAIARAERGLGTPSVVMADLDQFKAVNDALGHAVGDAVLKLGRPAAHRAPPAASTPWPASAATSSSSCSSTPAAPARPRPSAGCARSLEGGWSEVTGGHEVGRRARASRRTGPGTASRRCWPAPTPRCTPTRPAAPAPSEPTGAGPAPPVGTRVDRVPGLA